MTVDDIKKFFRELRSKPLKTLGWFLLFLFFVGIVVVSIGCLDELGRRLLGKKGDQRTTAETNTASSYNQTGGLTAGSIYGDVKIFGKESEDAKNPDSACSLRSEVYANMEMLENILGNFNKPNFDFSDYPIIYTCYNRVNLIFEDSKLNDHIQSFYMNLKRMSSGYSYNQLIETKGQGKFVLDQLREKFGCKDHFEDDAKTHAVSEDTLTNVMADPEHAVSGVTVEHAISNDTSQNK